MNKVILTAYVSMIDEEKKEALCCIDQIKQPLCCKLQPEHIKSIKAGDTVTFQAELHSRDITMRNPCNCNTVDNRVESYLVVSRIFHSAGYCNEATLDPVVSVQEGKLICVSGKTFQTVRVRLPENAGYATVTIPDKKIIPVGTILSVCGVIKVKEYKKHLVCPCCKQEYISPQLSLLVRGYLIK